MLKLIVHPFVLALLANSSTHKHTRTHAHTCALLFGFRTFLKRKLIRSSPCSSKFASHPD